MPRYYKPLPRFYLQPKGKDFYIFLSFRYNNERLRLPTGIKIANKKHWNTKTSRISTAAGVPDYYAPDDTPANDQLNRYEAECNKLWETTKGRLSMADFRATLEIALGRKTGVARFKNAVKDRTS